jgi:histidyl-tRNA synthetase
MKVKVKITKKQYIELMRTLGKIDFKEFTQINSIDIINFRKLYFDALKKYELWSLDKEFHKGVKESTVNIDINHINSLSKLLFEFNLREQNMSYHTAILSTVIAQTQQQIERQANILQTI